MANVIDPSPVAPDSSAPTGPEADPADDGSLFRRLRLWTESAKGHLADWRKEADEAYDFYNGHQWTDEEKQAFAADHRVAPIFNLTGINVDAVCGLEVNNRQDVKFLPRTAGDVKVNELLSSAAMWVRDEAQSEDEETDAFRDATIMGLGCTETRIDRYDPESIAIDRRDPTEMFYDPAAKKPNLIDRRFSGRIVMYDTDEALDMFPGQTVETLNAKWAALDIKVGKTKSEGDDFSTDSAGSPSSLDYKPKKICLVEIEWFDWQDGKKVMYQAFLGATSVLETNPLETWAYNWITFKRDKRSNTWYGLVRALRDLQKTLNKHAATILHIMATNAKGGLLYENGAFTNQRQAEKDWSNPQKNIEVAEGALAAGRIEPRVAPPLPAGLVQFFEFTIGLFRTVSGINVELLGTADRDQPASLELQRRQSAVTILAPLFDAKRRYHKEQGRTLLAEMKRLPKETLVRITVDPLDPLVAPQPPQIPPGTPPEQAQQAQQQYEQQMEAAQQAKQREMFVQFQLVSQALSDPSLKFDVIVDEAPSSPNQQQEITAKIGQLLSQGLQIPPAAVPILIENLGLPSTITEKLVDAVKGNDPQVQQLTQQLQQGAQALQQTQNELQGVKMDKSLDQAKVQTDQYKAETDRIKVRTDAITSTGGLPDPDGTMHPLAEVLGSLQAQQDELSRHVYDIGTVIAHKLPPTPMQAGMQ